MFTVYDVKVGAYMTPFFMKSKGEAIRAFTETSRDTTTQIGKYPSDFTLFELGSYNDEDASLSLYSSPQSLGVAIEFIEAKV